MCEKDAATGQITSTQVLLPGNDSFRFTPGVHFLEMTESVDKNVLQTKPSAANPEHSTLIAMLAQGKRKNVLRVWRYYSNASEKNEMEQYDLPSDTFHTVI